MNISLTPELEQFVASRVESGFYSSASEVVREALRMLFQRDSTREEYIEWLNEKIAEGIADREAGRVISGDDAYRELMERHRARKGQ